MSKLTEFYDGSGEDDEGRKISRIWIEGDDYFEYCHDYIQWLFPLQEPSNFHPEAPLLTEDDIKVFKANPLIQANLISSFRRFLNFLGLDYKEGQVVETENFEPIQFRIDNHNWFRISRILKSLRLLGCEEQAIAFYKYLKKIHEENGWVSENSFSYWKEAVNGLVEM
jgi:hypothetical protein